MEIDVKKLIGENIRRIRDSKGLKGPDIERETDGVISVARLSNYECGSREPDLETILLLSRAMKAKVRDLLAGIVEPYGSPGKPDRQDIIDDIDTLPASRMDEVRLALELIKFRKPRKSAEVIPVSQGKKGKRKK